MTGGPALPEGARYLPGFIGGSVEEGLLRFLDDGRCSTELQRRVQHFGWRYDYTVRRVTPDMDLGPLPAWLAKLATRLRDQGLFPAVPNQVIANEYLPGQGISAHVDCVPCFGDTIASLSMGGACVMRVAHREQGTVIERALAPRSLMLLTGRARYDWTHAIPARKSDPGPADRIPRTRRVSLTFRTVLPQASPT